MMNYAVNRLLERKTIFADLINGVLFDGDELIHSESLELLSPNAGKVYRDDKRKTHVIESRGDIRMKAEENLFSVIIAAEPQTMIDYAMPIRMMEYVVMEYKKQLQDLRKKYKESDTNLKNSELFSGIRKDDKLLPTIGIVLYFGTEEWDGNRSLYEILEFGDNTETTQEIKKYVPDFQLNIMMLGSEHNVFCV